MIGKEVLMTRGARKVIKICANVSQGERVLIITDPERLNIANLLMGVMEEGIEPVMAVMFPNKYDGQEPPDIIACAMLEADVVIMPVTKSISHSTAVHNALNNGARVLAMSAFVEEQMYVGGIQADFVKQRPECERFAEHFTNSNKVEITSSSGTKFTASIKGRNGNAHSCIVNEPGQYSAVPNIEANVAPVEGTAEGVIVVDGSVPNFGIGIVESPIVIKVKNGSITEITGGKEAALLNSLLKRLGDSTALNIAQIAIGLNPEIRRFNGIMLNDHGVYGSVHVGIGTSHNLGGEVKAPIHYDVMMANPTVSLDGRVVIDNGEVVG